MSKAVSLTVTGMKCGGCENTLTAKLLALSGIISVKASYQDKRVELEYDSLKIDLDDIEDAINEAGFNVET